VVSTPEYGSWDREFKSHQGSRIVDFQKYRFWVVPALNEYTLYIILREGKAARERRWPPPSYTGPRNVRVLILRDPTTVIVWKSYILFLSFNSAPSQHYRRELLKIHNVNSISLHCPECCWRFFVFNMGSWHYFTNSVNYFTIFDWIQYKFKYFNGTICLLTGVNWMNTD